MTAPDLRWAFIYHNDPMVGRCKNSSCHWIIAHWQGKEVHVARDLEAVKAYTAANVGGPS